MKVARTLARTTIGGLFIGHGTQKLFGWFGGDGLEGTTQMFEKLGLQPARRNAVAAGAAETAGGALLFAGLATPLAGATLTATMLTAIRRVHLPKGPWISNGGYEYNLVLITAVLALVEEPGRPSLDAALGRERKGTRWALAAAAAGALGAAVTHQLAEREAAALERQSQTQDGGATPAAAQGGADERGADEQHERQAGGEGPSAVAHRAPSAGRDAASRAEPQTATRAENGGTATADQAPTG